MQADSRKSSLLRSKLLWLGVLMVAGVITLLGLQWRQHMQLESDLAAIRAEGLPTTAPAVNDYYRIPEGVLDATGLWVAALDAIRVADPGTRGSTLPIIGQGSTPVPPPGTEWPQRQAARSLLTEMDRELQLAREAAHAGGQVRFPVDFSAGLNMPLTYVQDARQAVRLLQLDAHVSAHDGEAARSADDLLSIFALSHAYRGEPNAISLMMRIAHHAIGCQTAIELLPQCPWSDAQLADMQAAIRSADFKGETIHTLIGERAVFLSVNQQVTPRAFRDASALEILRLFDESIDGFSLSWPETLTRQHSVIEQVRSVTSNPWKFVRLRVVANLPPFEALAVGGARATARQSCAIVLISARRFALQHGAMPQSLAELQEWSTASGSSLELTDPFTGEPLHYQVDDQRVVIYSVGDNLLDDGGTQMGLGGQSQPLDIGFALTR